MPSTGTPTTAQHPVTAIDIVLEPDATMIQHAEAANAGLRKIFPKGYALDAGHKPHISVMGGYFYTANLENVYTATAKVLASEKVKSWKLTAFKYYYIPLKEIGLGGILVQPTTDMIRLSRSSLTHSRLSWPQPTKEVSPPSRPRQRIPTLTNPPSTLLQPTFRRTSEGTTARMSRSESGQLII
jgi:hypothetical protein